MGFLGTLRRGFRVSSGRVRVRVRLDQSGWSGEGEDHEVDQGVRSSIR